jgi:hypothetical protein
LAKLSARNEARNSSAQEPKLRQQAAAQITTFQRKIKNHEQEIQVGKTLCAQVGRPAMERTWARSPALKENPLTRKMNQGRRN